MSANTDDKPEKADKALNGEEKVDSGVETQNSEGNVEEEEAPASSCYYDKSKSFFDNISCDDTRYLLCPSTFPQICIWLRNTCVGL